MAHEWVKENDCMKARAERTCRTMVQLLIPGLALALQCGCASMDSWNSDPRAWGRPADLEVRDEQRRTIWWGWPFGNCPAMENQQAEEWLNSH